MHPYIIVHFSFRGVFISPFITFISIAIFFILGVPARTLICSLLYFPLHFSLFQFRTVFTITVLCCACYRYVPWFLFTLHLYHQKFSCFHHYLPFFHPNLFLLFLCLLTCYVIPFRFQSACTYPSSPRVLSYHVFLGAHPHIAYVSKLSSSSA